MAGKMVFLFLFLISIQIGKLVLCETQIFPSSYMVHASTVFQDNACDESLIHNPEYISDYFNCSRGRSTPRLIDCDIVLRIEMSSNLTKSYSLQGVGGASYNWLIFEFDVRVNITKAILYYYCTKSSSSENVDLFLGIIGHIVRPVECGNGVQNAIFPFTQENVGESLVLLVIHTGDLTETFIIQLNEIQFFSDEISGPSTLQVESDYCGSTVRVEAGLQQLTLSCMATTTDGSGCINWQWDYNETIDENFVTVVESFRVSTLSPVEQQVVSNTSIQISSKNYQGNYTCMAQINGGDWKSCWIAVTLVSNDNSVHMDPTYTVLQTPSIDDNGNITKSDHKRVGAIAGGTIAAGVLAVCVVITIVIACVIKRRRAEYLQSNSNSETSKQGKQQPTLSCSDNQAYALEVTPTTDSQVINCRNNEAYSFYPNYTNESDGYEYIECTRDEEEIYD